MKKLILSAAALLCISFSADAQNAIKITVEKNICLSSFSVVLSDNSESELSLGCEGNYEFDFGNLEVDYILVNGVPCYPETDTYVLVDNRMRTKASYKKSKVTIGGGTTTITR